MRARRSIIATIAFVVAGLLLGVAPEASAGPPDPNATTSADATTAPGVRADAAAAQAAATSYWTADRMRNAKLVPDPKGGVATPIPAKPTGPAGTTAARSGMRLSAPAPAGTSGAQAAATINESAVAGRVFFHKPSGGDWSCSGTAINSGSLQMVITAGHCVHEGAGGNYVTNWIFVPRYRSGASPFGQFAAKQFRTFTSWTTSSDLQRDVAVVTTWPLNGQKLVNVVGGDGLAWNQPRVVAITTVAYPSNFGSGEIQWICGHNTYDGGNYTNAINCNYSTGASGGGWYMNYSNATGLGSVNGVYSTLDGAGVNRASYFDSAVKAMYDAQANVT